MKSIVREIRDIQAMSVSELQAKWRELFDGQECRSRSRVYMAKRLCQRVQELACGLASAKAPIEEPPSASLVRARTTATAVLARAPRNVRRITDPRRPTPGTVLTRLWRGQEIRVLVVVDGFEWEGQRFRSLSEVARAITGSRWSGPLFFGLRKRKRS